MGSRLRCVAPSSRCRVIAGASPSSSNRFAARIDAALGDGRYRADVDGLGSLLVPGTPGLETGQKAIAIVRPEQVRGGGGTIAFDGSVENVAYLGPAVHLTLASALPSDAADKVDPVADAKAFRKFFTD